MNTSKYIKTLIVIPARLQSSRLPNKPLLFHGKKTLLEITYNQAKKTKVDTVVVATDDQEIIDYCTDKNINCVSTPDCPNGTSRCFHVYSRFIKKEYKRIINWQVDEPLVSSVMVDTLIESISPYDHSVYTLVAPITTKEQMHDHNMVKVVVSDVKNKHSIISKKKCFWFTRSPIKGLGHCGIYGFSGFSLWNAFSAKQTTAAEEESLEQLSWIEAGITVNAITMDSLPLSINVPEDWTQFCNEN